MSVKVVDLMDDLEQGDRSMEHLKKGNEPEGALRFSTLREAVNRLGAGIGQAGFPGGNLAGLSAQQGFMNQMANIQNPYQSANQIWRGNAAGL